MSFNKLGLATVVAMVLSAGSAMAADIPSDTGTITFHGMVSNNTCKVSLDQKIDQDGNDFDVNLDTVFVKDFANALGTTSTLGEKKFSLTLTGCDSATVKQASAQFDSWAGSSSTSGGLLVHHQTLKAPLKTSIWYCQTMATPLPIRSNWIRPTIPRKQRLIPQAQAHFTTV